MNLPKENFLYLLTPELPTVAPGTEEWERIFERLPCVFVFLFSKQAFLSFPPSDPSSPADTNYKLTIIDEHEGGKVKIGQFLQWDLILFLSRCITWPFLDVTQWTKLKETSPLWQASPYSDRCHSLKNISTFQSMMQDTFITRNGQGGLRTQMMSSPSSRYLFPLFTLSLWHRLIFVFRLFFFFSTDCLYFDVTPVDFFMLRIVFFFSSLLQ